MKLPNLFVADGESPLLAEIRSLDNAYESLLWGEQTLRIEISAVEIITHNSHSDLKCYGQ